MNEEEKKAIENIKEELNSNEFLPRLVFQCEDIEKIVNLIEKQQKELEKKDKIINAMAKYIADIDITENMCPTCKYRNTECTMQECVESIIEYYEKKVGE